MNYNKERFFLRTALQVRVRKAISVILTFVLIAGLLTILPVSVTQTKASESADEKISYINSDGNERSVRDYTIVESYEGDALEWGANGQESWYVVNSDVQINATIFLYGKVNLILCDKVTMNVEGSIIANLNVDFTIFGQTEDSGCLNVNNTGDNAAIGSFVWNQAGHIVICGGTINATTTGSGAAIGGGFMNNQNRESNYSNDPIDLVIMGGKVTASSNSVAIGNGSGGEKIIVRTPGMKVTDGSLSGTSVKLERCNHVNDWNFSGDTMICLDCGETTYQLSVTDDTNDNGDRILSAEFSYPLDDVSYQWYEMKMKGKKYSLNMENWRGFEKNGNVFQSTDQGWMSISGTFEKEDTVYLKISGISESTTGRLQCYNSDEMYGMTDGYLIFNHSLSNGITEIKIPESGEFYFDFSETGAGVTVEFLGPEETEYSVIEGATGKSYVLPKEDTTTAKKYKVEAIYKGIKTFSAATDVISTYRLLITAANGVEENKTLQIDGAGIYYEGDIVKLNAPEMKYYNFTGWYTYRYDSYFNGIYRRNELSTDSEYSLVMNGNYRIAAQYEAKPGVTIDVSLSDTSLEYNGKNQFPEVTVKDNNGEVLSTDYYSVVYEENSKEIGTYKLEVTFINVPVGTIEKTYDILPQRAIATQTVETDGISLKWNKVDNATGYTIYRSVNGGEMKRLLNVYDNDILSFKDTTARVNGTKYQYKVVSFTESETKEYTSKDYVTEAVYVLTKPTLAVANTATGVKLSWSKVANASGYKIYRKTGSGAYVKVTDINNNTTVSYLDTAAKTSGAVYSYYVRPFVKEEDSTIVFGVSSKTAVTAYVAAPAVKTLTASSKGTTVTWNKVTGATGYSIYRSVGTGKYALVKTVGSTVSSYLDTAAKANGTTYTYYIVANKLYGGVTYKSVAGTKKANVYLAAPVIKSAVNNATGRVTTTWTRNTKATGYIFRYFIGSKYKDVTITSNATLARAITSIKKGSTVKVYVRAYRSVGGVKYYSAWSAAKTLKTTR